MYNYESPIELIAQDTMWQLAEHVDNEVYRAVAWYGIKVNKEELLKALVYDRGQYDKGYDDGYRAAKKELVRCGKCVFYGDEDACPMLIVTDYTKPDFFCGYAERRTNDAPD